MEAVKRQVYSMKQAPFVNGKWAKSSAVIDREGVKLSDDEVKAYNANYQNSGRYYDVDEKATKVYLASIKKGKK